MNQKVIARMLAKLGYQNVQVVGDGAHAVRAVEDAPEGLGPALVLMDLHMPVMDGFEATRRIRELPHPAKRGTPIIAVSASVMPVDIAKSAEAGVNAHIGKPYNAAEIAELMLSLLGGAVAVR